jgi:hypothetical protein
MEKVDASLLRASGSRGLTREAPAEMLRGQEGRRITGGEESRRRMDFTCGGVGLNSGHGKDWGRGYPAREASWWGGEATAALAGAGVQRGGRSTAGQRARCGGARWLVVLGFEAAAVRR